jgi:hypothetical protein
MSSQANERLGMKRLDVMVSREEGLNTDNKFMLWWDNCPSHKPKFKLQLSRY